MYSLIGTISTVLSNKNVMLTPILHLLFVIYRKRNKCRGKINFPIYVNKMIRKLSHSKVSMNNSNLFTALLCFVKPEFH